MEEITIDYEKLNTFKEVCIRLQKQIAQDYTASTGSSMFKEDLVMAGIVCLLTKSYSVKK